MIRKDVYLTERQLEALNKQTKKLGISLAELIRRIIDQYLERQ